MSTTSDDVQRSIDILDKVLSEFDDIDGFRTSSDQSSQSSPQLSDSGSKRHSHNVSSSVPPPIDRSLKPRISPPTLPKKTKKKSLSQDSLDSKGFGSKNSLESTFKSNNSTASTLAFQPHISPLFNKEKRSSSRSHSSSNSSTNTKNSRNKSKVVSESSSHEYQEINAPIIDNERNKNDDCLQQNDNNRKLIRNHSSPAQRKFIPRHAHSLESKTPHHTGRVDPYLRKSRRSAENFQQHSSSFDNQRGRKPNKNVNMRRSKSTDRVFSSSSKYENPHFKHKMGSQQFLNNIDVGQQQFMGNPNLDPRLIDPMMFNMNYLDPLHFDQRNSNFFDPALNDPRFLEPPFMFDDPRLLPPMDPMHLSQLMTLPPGISGPHSFPIVDPNEFPHTIPRYHDHLPHPYPEMMLPTQHLQFNPFLSNPQFDSFDPALNEGDPKLMPPFLPPPPHMPLNYPMHYPNMNMPFMNYYPRENLQPNPELIKAQKYQERNNRHLDRKLPANHHNNKTNKNRKTSDEKNKNNAESDVRHKTNSERPHLEKSPPKSKKPAGDGFRVGEAVRRNNEKNKQQFKESSSLPHFIMGGKDSGFEEGLHVDEHQDPKNNKPPKGFVVAGVFSDSSKMYIPAPPSPTPDYDSRLHSDGEGELEEDIIQNSFYEDNNNKSPDGSKNSLSDDSLQSDPKEQVKNSLECLMKEFHSGLVSKTDEITYSDDSLEEESSVMSPHSGPNTMDASFRQRSVESLVSMDGSTTSFDYKPNLRSRSSSNLNRDSNFSLVEKNNNIILRKARRDLKPLPDSVRKSSSLEDLEDNLTNTRSTDSSGSNKSKKFDTIRNLIKEGLIEGLNETPPDFKPPPPLPKPVNKRNAIKVAKESSPPVPTKDSIQMTKKYVERSVSEPDANFRSNFSSKNNDQINSRKSTGSSQPMTRNESWLYRKKRLAPIPIPLQTSPNSSAKSMNTEEKRKSSPKLRTNKQKEKITHIDSIICSSNKESNKLPVQYATPHDQKSNHDERNRKLRNSVSSWNSDQDQSHKKNRISMIDDHEEVRTSSQQIGNPNTPSQTKSTKSVEKRNSVTPPKVSPNNTRYSTKYPPMIIQQNNKDSSDYKPKLNIFKGFWKRNKYSFDK